MKFNKNQTKRFKADLKRMIGDAGKVLEIISYENGWTVIFDTEYAALKAYYQYRHTPDVNFGESTNLGGWFLSVK